MSEAVINLEKSMFEKLVAAGVTRVRLEFSGGSDEGYLDTTLYTKHDGPETVRCEDEELNTEVHDWAEEAYAYSGAGGGGDYGDNIEYDLVNMTTSSEGWYTSSVYDDPETDELRFEEDEA